MSQDPKTETSRPGAARPTEAPQPTNATRRDALGSLGRGLGGLLLATWGTAPRAARAAAFASPRLTVAERGSLAPGGRDVLLIPGLASGPSVWAPLVARLPGYRFHLVHIAGFAGMPAGANARGPLLGPITAELAHYIRTRGLRAPAVIGHSMGGILAMRLGLSMPGALSRLIVADMLPDGSAMVGGTSAGLGYLAGQLNGYLTGTKAGRQILTQLVEQSAGGRGNDPHVIAQSLSELAQTDLKPRLRGLGCPLDVIYAQPADRAQAAERARLFRAAYAGTPRLALSGVGPSGHMVMLDQPERFAQTVRRFLQ